MNRLKMSKNICFTERASEQGLLRVLPPHRDVLGVLQSHPLRLVQRGLQGGVPEHWKVRKSGMRMTGKFCIFTAAKNRTSIFIFNQKVNLHFCSTQKQKLNSESIYQYFCSAQS